MTATQPVISAPAGRRILTFLPHQTGGVRTFWESLGRQFPWIEMVHVVQADRMEFDPASRTLRYSPFAPKRHVHALLARHIDPTTYDVLVANERFELEFFIACAATARVCFIVHGNHAHYYDAALQHASEIDRVLCVSETAVAHLKARGMRHAQAFEYSIFVDQRPAVQRRNRVLYVGRFEADKNVRETLELFHFLKRQRFEVGMIGVGSLAAEMAAGLTPGEVSIGLPRAEVLAAMAESRFLCLNSYVEGLPITYLEARHFQLGVLCNYVDASMHRVLGENFILCSDWAAVARRMSSFTFQPPGGPDRVNNPSLNERFLDAVVSTPLRSEPRASRIGGLLDRSPLLPARAVTLARRLRWKLRRSGA